MRACVLLGALLLTVGQLAMTPMGASAATFTTFAAPLTGATDFASGFPTCKHSNTPGDIEGPIGVLNDGASMFVADFCNDSTYKFPAAAPPNPVGGYNAATATHLANGIDGGLAAQNGLYYGVQAFHLADDGVYLFDPGTLTRGKRISTFPCVPIGVVGDPQTPALYVTTLCGIYVVADPTVATPTATLFAGTSARSYDGIYFTSDGNHVWSAFIAPTSGVQEFTRAGAVELDKLSPHGSDGLAVAKATAPNGIANNAFVNSNDGTIQRVDTNTAGSPITVVASGGTRGDHVTTGPDGCLYPTQTDRVEKLAPCFFQAPPPVGMTGRAYGAAATSTTPLGTVTVPPTPDTGAIFTTMAGSTTTPCTASLTGGPVGAHVLCANVTTTLGPPASHATASIADATVLPGVKPLIEVTGVAASSNTSCAGSTGSATIATLKINGVPIAVSPGPNTTILLPGGSLILNEQVPLAGPDKGLTVNALHLHIKTGALLTLDVVLASAKSDIHNCQVT